MSFGTNGVAQFALSAVDNRSDRGTTIDVQPDGIDPDRRTHESDRGLGYDFLLMRSIPSGARDPVLRHQRRRGRPVSQDDE